MPEGLVDKQGFVKQAILRIRPDAMLDLQNLLMGWKGFTNTKDKIFGEVADQVIRHAPCDLVVLKLAKYPIKNILLPSAGGPNAKLASEYASVLTKDFDADLTSCFVIPRKASDEDREKAWEWIDKTLENKDFPKSEGSASGGEVKKKLIESDSVPAGLIREGKNYDLIMIGASKEGFFKRMFLGEIPERVARHSSSSVMVVKKYEGAVKSWIKKFFG